MIVKRRQPMADTSLLYQLIWHLDLVVAPARNSVNSVTTGILSAGTRNTVTTRIERSHSRTILIGPWLTDARTDCKLPHGR